MRASFIVACAIGLAPYVTVVAQAQFVPRATATPDILSCSPAPCILPPVLASEGGFEVADAPIVSNPLNSKHLLLGADDWNCPNLQFLSYLGFYVSNNGGSSWNGPVCMTGGIHIGGYVYFPSGNPMVGYDRQGTAYIAGNYYDNEGGFTGLVALQKSSDGINWSPPGVVLRQENRFPNYSWLAVDTGEQSPRVNSLYVSGVQVGSPGFPTEQVMVSHSKDGGGHLDGGGGRPSAKGARPR